MQGAVARARDYVVKAIRLAPGLGKGHGPLEFAHPLLTAQASDAPPASRALH